MQHRLRPAFAPTPPRLLKTRLNHMLTTRFRHTPADIVARLGERRIPHPPQMRPQIVALFARNFRLSLRRRLPLFYRLEYPRGAVGKQRFLLRLQPVRAGFACFPMPRRRHIPSMRAGGVKVQSLHPLRIILARLLPHPLRSARHKPYLAAVLRLRFMPQRSQPLAKGL